MKDRTLAGQPDAAPPTEVPFSLWATGAGFGLYLAWGMLGASPSLLSPDVAAAVSFTAIGSLAERAVWLGFLVLYAAWAGIRRAAPNVALLCGPRVSPPSFPTSGQSRRWPQGGCPARHPS